MTEGRTGISLGGMRALSATLPKITRTIWERGGGDYAALVAEWAEIVGPSLAGSSLPEKLARRRLSESGADLGGGVLTIRVSGGAAMEIQHREPQLLERINAYLGHRAVTRIKLMQGPIPGRRRRGVPTLPALTPTETQAIDSLVQNVADSALQARLARFGHAVAGRAKTRRR